MMRTLLDRLLFALPSPPSRASLVRGGLYLLFGLLLYGLFLGVLYMRELGVVGLRQWCGRLPGVQVSMSRPEMSFFPPALEIADLTVQPPNASEPLAFRNVRAGLTVFPLGISLDADIAGGELNATVIPSSLWNPERLAVRSSLSGVGIEPLLRPFMGKTSLVQIRSGKLEGSATLEPTPSERAARAACGRRLIEPLPARGLGGTSACPCSRVPAWTSWKAQWKPSGKRIG